MHYLYVESTFNYINDIIKSQNIKYSTEEFMNLEMKEIFRITIHMF